MGFFITGVLQGILFHSCHSYPAQVQMLQLGSDAAVSSSPQTLTEPGNSSQKKKRKKCVGGPFSCERVQGSVSGGQGETVHSN